MERENHLPKHQIPGAISDLWLFMKPKPLFLWWGNCLPPSSTVKGTKPNPYCWWLKSCTTGMAEILQKGRIKSEKLPPSTVACHVLAGIQPLQEEYNLPNPLQWPFAKFSHRSAEQKSNTQIQSAKMIEIIIAVPKHHSVPLAEQRPHWYYLGWCVYQF